MKFTTRGLGCFLLTALPQLSCAATFGMLGPRATGMGGTGVVSAESADAVYFNPALLATYPQYKEHSGDPRFAFPVIAARFSSAAWDLADFQTHNYEHQLSQSVNSYNASPGAAAAAGVAETTSALRSGLSLLNGEKINVDGQLSMLVAVPTQWQGGAFFVQTRAVGSGVLNLTDADVQILNDYVDGLNFVATGGAAGRSVPSLFDAQGRLIDPTNTLTSTASARGALLVESGVSMADKFTWRDVPMYWGFTPKIQAISVFDYVEKAAQGGLDVSHDINHRIRLNADLGWAMDFHGSYRAGFTARNLIPQTLTTPLNTPVKIQPQVRAGLGRYYGNWLFTTDLDLVRNPRWGYEAPSQEWAFGTEYRPMAKLALRAGYVHNLQDIGAAGLVTAGVGVTFFGVDFELAAGVGDKQETYALQLAGRF